MRRWTSRFTGNVIALSLPLIAERDQIDRTGETIEPALKAVGWAPSSFSRLREKVPTVKPEADEGTYPALRP